MNYNNLHFLLIVPAAGQAGWDPLSRAPSSSSAQTSSGSPLLLPSIFWHPMTFRPPKHLTTWTGFSTGFDEEDELVSTFCSDSGSTLSSPLAIMASGVAPLTYLAGLVDPSIPNALLDLQRFTKQNTHSTYEQYTLFSSWNIRCFTTCFTPFWEWFSTQLGRRSFFIATPLVVFPSSTTNKWFQAFPTSPSSFSRSSLFRSFVVFTSTFLTGDSNCCLPEKPMISEKMCTQWHLLCQVHPHPRPVQAHPRSPPSQHWHRTICWVEHASHWGSQHFKTCDENWPFPMLILIGSTCTTSPALVPPFLFLDHLSFSFGTESICSFHQVQKILCPESEHCWNDGTWPRARCRSQWLGRRLAVQPVSLLASQVFFFKLPSSPGSLNATMVTVELRMTRYLAHFGTNWRNQALHTKGAQRKRQTKNIYKPDQQET